MILYLDLSHVDLEKLANEGVTYETEAGKISIKIIFPKSANSIPHPKSLSGQSGDTSLPSDFPSDDDKKFISEVYPTINVQQEAALFRDYYKDMMRTNWSQAWKRWCQRSQTDYRNGHHASTQEVPEDYYSDAINNVRRPDGDN
tara:strand:+ start:626 stop:1057 length:432 start_codon:yes stop_codon:yes gene_type:complete